MRSHRPVLYLIAVAALGLAGCGSNDEPSAPVGTQAQGAVTTVSAEEAPDPTSEIRGVADRFYSAYDAGKWDEVCGLMAPSAKAQLAQGAAFLGTKPGDCAGTVAAASTAAGSTGPSKPNVTTVKVDGSKAVAPGAQMQDGSPADLAFEKADGKWLIAADPEEEGSSGEGLRARVQEWPKAWCQLDAGASREELRKALGKPTGGTDDQDSWEGFGLALTAFYDADLTSYQLQVGEGDVPCADVRKAAGRD